MTRCLILVWEGFSDVQFAYAYHRLREEGLGIDVGSPTGGAVTGASGLTAESVPIGAIEGDVDIALIPQHESRPGEPVVEFVTGLFDTESVIGVLGTSVELLATDGYLEGKTVTGPERSKDAVTAVGATWTGKGVEVDGQLVTGRDDEMLPFFVKAALNNFYIPQASAMEIAAGTWRERPGW